MNSKTIPPYNLVLAICIVLFAVSLYLFFKGRNADVAVMKERMLQYEQLDRERARLTDSALAAASRLDSSYTALRNQIDSYESSLTSTKQSYDKKRTDLANLPVSGQFQFFAEWLPKANTVK